MATAFSGQNSMLSCLNSLYPFESDDTFLTDLLQIKPESPSYLCGSCDEGTSATSRCRDCNEYLCDSCVRAHLRVRLTKDHCILRVSGSPIQLSPFLKTMENSPNGSIYCEHHASQVVNIFCDTCCLAICSDCGTEMHRGHSFIHLQDAIDNVRSTSLKLLSDSRVGAQAVRESLEMTQKMLDAVNVRAHSVIRDIRIVVSKFQSALKERETELLSTVEAIRKSKLQVLHKQSEGLKSALSRFTSTAEQLSEVLEIGSPIDLIQVKTKALLDFTHFRNSRVGLSPQENDCITFLPPDLGLLRAIAAFGEVNRNTFHACNPSDGLLVNSRSRMPSLTLSNKSSIDELANGHDSLPNYVVCDNGKLPSDFNDRHDTDYLSYSFNLNCSTVTQRSTHHIIRSRQGIPSTYPVCVCTARKYAQESMLAGVSSTPATLAFGEEGDADGELCRPWGVCCDLEGNIVVADRSNNRIQVFKSDGSFLRKFGSHGSEPGQFDRPAGVATNPLGHIVVADKDNHRIQIFTNEGQFIFAFGDKGSKSGQFNYPWDVDVNSEGLIVVSDTRNHRIQLFSADGSFISKYGFENNSSMWKHFDSPRGVSFGPNSSIVVTDFNNHRLVVIEQSCLHARFLGSEGSGTKQFLRPQGVAVDYDGHLVVADSRNNRIQIFENNGSFVWQFGTSGKEPGQFDRPSGICLAPDGKIVVVDFGNNRIQIF